MGDHVWPATHSVSQHSAATHILLISLLFLPLPPPPMNSIDSRTRTTRIFVVFFDPNDAKARQERHCR